MYNGEVELDKMVKDMEGEILALQTAHQRPLGALNFFRKSVDIPVNLTSAYGIYSADIYITVKVKKPSVKPPIVQLGYDVPAGFYTVWFYGVETDTDYETWTYELSLDSPTISSTTLKVGAVSSQPIESITWSIR